MKIKRPLFIFALSVLVVINMINTLPGSIFYSSLAMFILFAIAHRFTKNKYTQHFVIITLAAIIAIGGFGLFKNNLKNKIEFLSSQENIILEGTVVNKDNTSYTNCFHIDVDKVNDKTINNFKVVMYTEEYLTKGDKVVLTGKYKSFTPTSNYLYRYSQGIFGYFYADNITIFNEESGILSVFSDVRTALTDKSRKIFDYDTVALAVAMGFGDKSLVDQSVLNSFKYMGLAHALVVSGLHIGFIVSILSSLMYCIPLNKKLKNIVLCLLLFIFMGIISFTPSIIRAGCLILSVTIGRTLIVETDNYTVLGIVILITLLFNPYSANNGSLLLSYAAYFGVVQAAEISSRRNFGKIKSFLLISVFATLYTTPVLSMLGMDITLLSPIFNLLLTYIIMVICVLSFFLPVISFIPAIGTILAVCVAPVNDVLIRLLMNISAFAENNLSFAMIDLNSAIVKVIIFSVLIAMLVAFVQFEKKTNRINLILAVPIISVLCYNFMNRGAVTVKVFDGSSEPSYVIVHNEKSVLVATENINSSKLENVTEEMNITSFDQIIICSLKEADTQMYSEYSDNIFLINESYRYTDDIITINTQVTGRQMAAVLEIGGVSFGFNHNKADMSGTKLDFYFFGSSTPKDVTADNFFYFYPVIKKNYDLVTDKQAVELYDILEIKIINGNYSIVEDVKNFGSRI